MDVFMYISGYICRHMYDASKSFASARPRHGLCPSLAGAVSAPRATFHGSLLRKLFMEASIDSFGGLAAYIW
jgi:hypothetical protein